MNEDRHTKPKNVRKGNIDGAEAKQSQAARKRRRPKRGARLTGKRVRANDSSASAQRTLAGVRSEGRGDRSCARP